MGARSHLAWQAMMHFVENDPVRTAGLGSELGQLWQQLGEKARPLMRVDRQQIEDNVGIRLLEKAQGFGDARHLLCIAHHVVSRKAV